MKNIAIALILLIVVILGGYIIMNREPQVVVVDTDVESPDTNNPAPNSAEGAPEGSIHNLPTPDGVRAAQALLAQNLKVETSKVLITSAFEKQWSDSCLGLGGPAESCLQVITPGYEVTMQVDGKTYIYRTNREGTVIRVQQ